MLADIVSRLAIVSLTSGGTMAAVAITGEHATVIEQLGIGVAAIVAAIAWIDNRIAKRNKETERATQAAHDTLRREMRAEVRALREALAIAGVMPDLTPEPIALKLEEERET